MGLSRRALIKQTGVAIAALGLTDLALSMGDKFEAVEPLAKAYGQALAQPGGRKLALLIGIDNYAKGALPPDQVGQLHGATTDVLLQKELLIHRFGFAPADVVTLTNEAATRAGIYQAFTDHLYRQAKSGDVVVVHFSGYGAQVRTGEESAGRQSGRAKTVRSLVPYDGVLPTEKRPTLKDISEAELTALLKQLRTKNITTIIDAGFSDIPVPFSGGLRSRTRSAIATGQLPAPFPLLAEQGWGQGLAPQSEAFPGIVLRGADVDEVVIERPWNGFNAGAFTYVLTQYLWTVETPVTVAQVLGQSQETLLRWGGSNQQPVAKVKGAVVLSNRAAGKTPPIYQTPLVTGTGGAGVIHEVSQDGKTATLWLGGLPPRVLEYVGPEAVLTCGGRRLEVRSHTGLTGKAKLAEDSSNDGAPLQVGLPVQEAVRILPKSIDLVVALDSRLERIERVDATSALSALPFVSSTSDTELPADCLLGKPTSVRGETLTASLTPSTLSAARQLAPEIAAIAQADENFQEEEGQFGYGLFSLTRSLIPGTLAFQDEAIKPAINRLTTKLQALMALKMLRLSENSAASTLPIRVTLEQVGISGSNETKLLINRQTLALSPQPPSSSKNNPGSFTPEVSIGSRVRYRLFNEGNVPLYYTLINVDPRERLSAFCPVTAPKLPEPAAGSENNATETATASIAPGRSVTVPSNNLDWTVQSPTGPVETYVVCSTTPLTNTLAMLTAISNGDQRINSLPNPLEVVETLLGDLSQGDDNDAYRLDVSQWATLNFTYQTI